MELAAEVSQRSLEPAPATPAALVQAQEKRSKERNKRVTFAA
jgi:hypothetical protein